MFLLRNKENYPLIIPVTSSNLALCKQFQMRELDNYPAPKAEGYMLVHVHPSVLLSVLPEPLLSYRGMEFHETDTKYVSL